MAAQLGLFDQLHDPGGKVSTALPAGLRGDAEFCGDRQQYRPLLRRWVGDSFPAEFVLFIGMNPSTASATVNDPTIGREWGFAVREGFSGFVKCNVSDYRATKPADLLRPGLALESAGNRQAILTTARSAAMVIVCWGAVNRALAPLSEAVEHNLRDAGVRLMCFGVTAGGHPRHPLYLRRDEQLRPYASPPARDPS